jgi:hypothetical protein
MQVVRYGEALLDQLCDVRSKVLVGLLDVKKIRFLELRREGNETRLFKTDEFTHVLEALCALLRMGASEVCACCSFCPFIVLVHDIEVLHDHLFWE